jgi:hypothetical protein
MDRLWQLTREWRIVCTNEAREAVYRLGEKGTRRGEIVKAVARNLAPGTDPKIDDIGELLTRFPARRYELRAFFKWVSELYLYNHARQMQAIPNLPAYNALTSVLLDREPSGPSLLVEPAAPSLTELIEVPPLRVLRKVPPQVLIDIRNDKGAEYLAALSAWHEKPQDAGRSAALQKALKKYGQQLVKWSGGDTKTLMQVVFGGLSASGRRMIEGAIAAALANLRAYPKLSSYGLVGMAAISVAELTYAAYLWAWQSPEEQTLELMAPNLEESEVNVPKQESISE